MRRVDGTLRVNVQLVATETGTHFWADHFDIGRNGADNNVDDVVREIGLALTRLERSLAIAPDVSGWRQLTYRFLAAAYARIGRLPEAKRAIAEPDRLFPYDTVRAHWPDDPSTTVYAEQIRHFQDGLRLAGERDQSSLTPSPIHGVDRFQAQSGCGVPGWAATSPTWDRTACARRCMN